MDKATLYHATSHVNAEKILKNGFIIPKNDWGHFYGGTLKKQPGSLGYGMYGFLDDKRLAGEFWTSIASYSEKYDIIKIEAKYDTDKCLDLMRNLTDMRFFREFLREAGNAKQIQNLQQRFHNTPKQHAFDGALIEYYIVRTQKRKWFKSVHCVRSATTSNVYNNIDTLLPNGIEYCIRNAEIISDWTIEKE